MCEQTVMAIPKQPAQYLWLKLTELGEIGFTAQGPDLDVLPLFGVATAEMSSRALEREHSQRPSAYALLGEESLCIHDSLGSGRIARVLMPRAMGSISEALRSWSLLFHCRVWGLRQSVWGLRPAPSQRPGGVWYPKLVPCSDSGVNDCLWICHREVPDVGRSAEALPEAGSRPEVSLVSDTATMASGGRCALLWPAFVVSHGSIENVVDPCPRCGGPLCFAALLGRSTESQSVTTMNIL